LSGASKVAEAKYRLRVGAGTHAPTFPLLRLLPNAEAEWMVSSETDVCIEGYPRSANSYAYRAFQRWNPECRIAHHMHVPMQVRRAVRRGIPTAVLIRDPADAVASLAVFYGGEISIPLLLSSYRSFYESVMSLRERVAICPFETVIGEPSSLPRRINERWGSSFTVGNWDAEDDSAVKQKLTDYHQTERTGLESRLPLPTAAKDAAKQEVEQAIVESPGFAAARETYLRFREPEV
jgi:hypothetical protein